jgi:uncharacterized small protein (DUF1192 family)
MREMVTLVGQDPVEAVRGMVDRLAYLDREIERLKREVHDV